MCIVKLLYKEISLDYTGEKCGYSTVCTFNSSTSNLQFHFTTTNRDRAAKDPLRILKNPQTSQ